MDADSGPGESCEAGRRRSAAAGAHFSSKLSCILGLKVQQPLRLAPNRAEICSIASLQSRCAQLSPPLRSWRRRPSPGAGTCSETTRQGSWWCATACRPRPYPRICLSSANYHLTLHRIRPPNRSAARRRRRSDPAQPLCGTPRAHHCRLLRLRRAGTRRGPPVGCARLSCNIPAPPCATRGAGLSLISPPSSGVLSPRRHTPGHTLRSHAAGPARPPHPQPRPPSFYLSSFPRLLQSPQLGGEKGPDRNRTALAPAGKGRV